MPTPPSCAYAFLQSTRKSIIPKKDGGLQSVEEKEIYILSHPFLDAIVTTTLRKSICRFLQEMSIQYAGGYKIQEKDLSKVNGF